MSHPSAVDTSNANPVSPRHLGQCSVTSDATLSTERGKQQEGEDVITYLVHIECHAPPDLEDVDKVGMHYYLG